jgi:protein-S-isoprenylcysteine O-methyltransferase Ste14
MYAFLIPLLLGFVFNGASAFTAAFSRRWGERGGQAACVLLRNVAGIPLWASGLGLAVWAPSPMLFAPGIATDAVGWLLVAAGSLVILWALVALRWPAARPSLRDTVVVRGPYAHVRHPMYVGLLLELAGVALLSPSQTTLLACALGGGWLIVQVKLEELDLQQRIPAYREYMERVPRFLPRLGPSQDRQQNGA